MAWKMAALHGDKSQDERLKSLDAFKRGEVDPLVATDVAARGLDIADLPAVFYSDCRSPPRTMCTALAEPVGPVHRDWPSRW